MNTKKILFIVYPYGISLISFSVALAITLSTNSLFGRPIVFTIFLPAVMVSAWYGGVLSGLVTNTVSTVAIYYFFTPPYNSFQEKSLVTVVQLIIFISEGLIINYFIDSRHRQEKITMYRIRDKQQKVRIEHLEKQLATAQQETALRDEFLAIASHELKTPLTTVVLQIQTSLHNIRNVSLSEFSVEHLLHMLQNMQNQTKRLSKMINDLLNVSLITTHKMELEPEEIELGTLIQDTADSFQEKFEREKSSIHVVVHDTILGKWDKLRLEQVLDNLLSNALKYGNKKPVQIELRKKDGLAEIQVVDHGIGIRDSDRKKIFTLFKRGSVEKDYRGLGIGLYIAQQIMHLHGGTIHVKSSLNHGSIFTIQLPILSQ